MTAVANPPTFPQLNRPTWGANGGHAPNSDDVRGILVPRKNLQRSNSSSSIASSASDSSTTTVATNGSQSVGTPASSTGEVPQFANRKRPQPKSQWAAGKGDAQSELSRMNGGHTPLTAGLGGAVSLQSPSNGQPQNISHQMIPRPPSSDQMPSGQPVLYLLPLNGTFERKTIQVPYAPDSLRIGRQTNQKTVPNPLNGFFDSKVLSRQHAEIWADRSGKIFIRDIKSSNGTFVNKVRLSPENRESEPHELNTSDHLELGIDILQEDQKTVMHHKVSAKVEHAGPLSNGSNVLEMGFNELDPSTGMSNAMQLRNRNGLGAGMANGRMLGTGMMGGHNGGIPYQRSSWLNYVTTDQVVKSIRTELHNAQIQSHDLARTNEFINALLSKDDVKDLEISEPPEPPKQPLLNGNVVQTSFRADVKPRFSDPPAPPPKQPLPEKPDIPSLKKASLADRPKAHPPTTSPIRENNMNQILQLQEDLRNTRKELEGRDLRLRELEETLEREREARSFAEALARKLEDSASVRTNGSVPSSTSDSTAEGPLNAPEEGDSPDSTDDSGQDSDDSLDEPPDKTDAIITSFQIRIDAMTVEMRDMREQLEAWQQRCRKAEAERDADRKSLADMVLQIRKDQDAREAAAEENSRRRSNSYTKDRAVDDEKVDSSSSTSQTSAANEPGSQQPEVLGTHDNEPTSPKANPITAQTSLAGQSVQEVTVAASLPYASILGVVLVGMSLMAVINGWQQAKIER